MLKPFSAEEISAHLLNLKEWVYVNNAIQKEWAFKDFKTAIAFINTVAQLAERQDHHPKIINTYNRVRIRLNTHAVNGITHRDFKLAKMIDQIT